MLSFERTIAGKRIIVQTHDNIIHADELAALWLAEKFADQNFLNKYCSSSKLTLGTGGGDFDEHSTKKKGECSMTLMVAALSVKTDPNLQKILKFITKRDLTTSGHPFDIANIANVWQTNSGKINLPELINWFFIALDANYAIMGNKGSWLLNDIKILLNRHSNAENWFVKGLAVHTQDQMEFMASKDEYEKIAQKETFQRDGKTFQLVVLKSDNPKINRYARWKEGGNAAIVIQQTASGNVSIFTNNRYGIRLWDLAKMLNLVEQDHNKGRQITDWKTLSQEGFIPNGKWYNLKGKFLLNGSLTHPEIPPTSIPLKNIISLVKIALSTSSFAPSYAKNCSKGKCASTQNSPCPWYDFGLSRCHNLRKTAEKFIMK